MLGGCLSLINLEHSNFNTKNVLNIKGMFGHNVHSTNLDIDISKFQTVKVTVL